MSKLLTRALQLEKEYNNREHTPYNRGMKAYLTYLPLLVFSKDYQESSKQLLLGLTAAMEGSVKGEGALGIFNPDFKKLASLTARGLLLLEGEKEASLTMKERLLSRLILGSLVASIGLLSSNIEESRESLGKEGTDFYTTLLMRTLVGSNLLESTFKTITESCRLKNPLAPKLIETLALITFLQAFLPKKDAGKEALFEALKERLEINFIFLESRFNDRQQKESELAPLMLFLKEGKNLLNKGNYERFLIETKKLITAYDLSLENLQEDVNASKRLFSVLQSGNENTGSNASSSVSFVG